MTKPGFGVVLGLVALLVALVVLTRIRLGFLLNALGVYGAPIDHVDVAALKKGMLPSIPLVPFVLAVVVVLVIGALVPPAGIIMVVAAILYILLSGGTNIVSVIGSQVSDMPHFAPRTTATTPSASAIGDKQYKAGQRMGFAGQSRP